MGKLEYAMVFLFCLLVAVGIIGSHAYTNVIEELNNHVVQLEDKNEKLQESERHLESELSESYLELTEIEEDHANLLSSHWDLSQSLVQYKQQIQDLEQENEKLRKELNQYTSLDVQATYYTAFCDTGCTGVTATGYNVSDTIYYKGLRIVAVDKAVIPLGTKLRVETPYQTFDAIALDVGGAIKGNKIDILVSSKAEARKLGNVQAKVVWKQ